MSKYQLPDDFRYTDSHYWLKTVEGGIRLGITDYLQDSFGTLSFIELPRAGAVLKEGDPLAVVEAVKVSSELAVPFDCTVVRVNDMLAGKPGLLNQDPYNEGWLCEIKPASALLDIATVTLNSKEYRATLDE